jgi:uncharacterized damage-inducible protein DinB
MMERSGAAHLGAVRGMPHSYFIAFGKGRGMPMNILVDLCQASDHANNLLLREVEKLDPSELRADHSPSHGSVWNLLLHMVIVETHYSRSSQSKIDEFGVPNLDTLADLRGYWADMAFERQNYLSSLLPDQVSEIISLRIGDHEFKLPRHQVILQGIMHSVHHRGELSIIMTELGHPLPTMDGIVFFVKESGQEWPYN